MKHHHICRPAINDSKQTNVPIHPSESWACSKILLALFQPFLGSSNCIQPAPDELLQDSDTTAAAVVELQQRRTNQVLLPAVQVSASVVRRLATLGQELAT